MHRPQRGTEALPFRVYDQQLPRRAPLSLQAVPPALLDPAATDAALLSALLARRRALCNERDGRKRKKYQPLPDLEIASLIAALNLWELEYVPTSTNTVLEYHVFASINSIKL